MRPIDDELAHPDFNNATFKPGCRFSQGFLVGAAVPPGQVLTLFETKNVILHPLSDLVKGMQDGGQTDIIVMEFPKAFDKVPHQELL